MTSRFNCAQCGNKAEVICSWPASIAQRHALCLSCGQSIWDKISTDFSGTEACMCFSIEPLSAAAMRHMEEE